MRQSSCLVRLNSARGYSLLELLIVLLVSTILLSALLLSLNYVQLQAQDISLRTDRDENFWVAPLLLVQWIAGAGNNRWGQNWNGVILAAEISLFRSDIDGSEGFPDHELASSFEDIAVRHRDDVLSIRSGSGSFQPVLRRILSFETVRHQKDLLTVRWSSSTRYSLRSNNAQEDQSAELKIHLWNYRENLFEEESP